jgi:hypothetical protein
MKALRVALPKIAILLFISGVSVAQTAPTITRISPTVGPVSPVGGPVTIKGSGFGAVSDTVTFAGIPGIVSSWSDTKIVVAVPGNLPAGFVDVGVSVNGVASNTQSFLVIPVITQISPLSGVVGTSVTITGTSFGDQQGQSIITFGGVPATATAWTNKSITAVVPNTASLGPIVVTVNGFDTNGVSFPVTPSIAAVQPAVAAIGAQVTIKGGGFGPTPGTIGSVTVNGVAAQIGNWSTNSITAIVPTGASSGNVVVTTADNLVSNGVNFNIGQPLSIVATANPVSNGATWNNSPVTVSFQCSGGVAPVTCPPSQTASAEGIAQVVSGTASDSAGNAASASVTLNIDETPPVVNLGSTANGTTVTRQVLRVTGSVSDNLSGVATASCNGSAAVIQPDGTFVCNISLASGVNVIQAQAVDAAGNTSTSAQLSVTYAPITPTAIFITPTVVNMVAGQSKTVNLVGNPGQPVFGATWTISDPTIASITTNDPPQLTALSQGTATLTASLSGLTATMTVNVLSGTSLPAGTVLWSVGPTSGNTINNIIRGNPVNQGDPDLYVIDGPNTVRALTADGQQLWTVQVNPPPAVAAAGLANGLSTATSSVVPTSPSVSSATLSPLWSAQKAAGIPVDAWGQRLAERQRRLKQVFAKPSTAQPGLHGVASEATPAEALPADNTGQTFVNQTIADNSGGIIQVLETCLNSQCLNSNFSFTRVDNASQQQTWSLALHDGSDENLPIRGAVAIAPDDTIYASVAFGPVNDDGTQPNSAIIGIDGATGRQKFTAPIPRTHGTFTLTDVSGNILQDVVQDLAGERGPIAVMPDGSMQTLVFSESLAAVAVQQGVGSPCGIGQGSCDTSVSEHLKLQLLTVQPDGSSSLQPVKAYDFDANNCGVPTLTLNPCNEPMGKIYGYQPQEVIPDGLGGTLAEYTTTKEATNSTQATFNSFVRHIDNSGGIQDYDMGEFLVPLRNLDTFEASQSLVLGANNIAYGTGQATVAFDVTSGVQSWHTPFGHSIGIVAGTADQTLVAAELSSTFKLAASATAWNSYDSAGVLTQTPLSSPLPAVAYFDIGKLMGLTASGEGQLMIAPTAINVDPGGIFNLQQGNKAAQRAPALPELTLKKQISPTLRVPLVGIAQGQTESISITSNQRVSPTSSGAIQLSLQTDQGTGGSASFGDGTTQMTIHPTASAPSVIQLKGTATSSKADNISLIAKIGKNIILRQKFSVVNVALALRTGAGLVASDDDSAKVAYEGTFGIDTLGPFAFVGDLGCKTGVEFVGTVSPSDYAHTVVLRRTLLSRSAWDGSSLIGQDTPNQDDTSNTALRDDDPQSGGSSGKSYDLDAPGVANVTFGHTFHVRQNLQEYVVLDDASNTVSASTVVPWFSVVSCFLGQDGPILTNNIENDNRAAVGCTPLSLNLQGSCQ